MTDAGQALDHFMEPVAGDPDIHLSHGSDARGHSMLVALNDGTIGHWLASVGRDVAGIDDKARAAYLIGDIAWALGMQFGALQLAARGVPNVAAAQVMAAPEWYRWEEDGESGESLRFTLRLVAQAGARHQALELDGIRQLIETLHAPLIERLHAVTRLGRNALWRLVADAIAVGWLNVGKRIGRASEAMEQALAIVRVPGSPLNNKQIGFFEVVVADENNPGKPLACEWFRSRGGCCRYYTTEAAEGDWCTSCVLRPAESQRQLLHDYVKRKALA